MRKIALAAIAAFVLLSSPRPAHATEWDYTAGGVPGRQFLLAFDLGFSALPRVSLQYDLLSKFSLGIAAQFDYAAFSYLPTRAFAPALGLSFPMRIEAYRGGRISFGIKLEPGAFITFAPFVFGAQLGVGFNVGAFVVNRFLVGGGLDMPVAIYLVGAGGVSAIFPILMGPIMEFHISNLFALAFDLKIGPGVHTGGGVDFAMKLLFGLVFHF